MRADSGLDDSDDDALVATVEGSAKVTESDDTLSAAVAIDGKRDR
jgi:hypothetical protein